MYDWQHGAFEAFAKNHPDWAGKTSMMIGLEVMSEEGGHYAIIENYSWRYSFGFAGACILIVILPLILIFASKSPEDTTGKVKEDVKATDNTLNNDEYFMLSDVMKLPATWAILFGYIMATFSNMAIVNHAVPFFSDCGMDAAKAAAILSVGSAVLIIGKIAIGALFGKLGTFKTSIMELIMITLAFGAFLLVGITKSPIIIVLFVILYGFGCPMSTISIPLSISHMFKKCDYGSIVGLFNMTGGIGGMLQIVVSLVYDKTGTYNAAWIGIMILCLISIGLFSFGLRPQEKK